MTAVSIAVFLVHGSTSLNDYLSENKVEYLVDYAIYASIPEFPVMQTFPINDGSGRSIHIWRVSPQLTSVP